MRLLVTRPEPDATRTAAALRARGHEVVVAPLMRIEPVAADIRGGYDAILMTSANAARADVWRDLPVLTVGARSADAARAAGFTNVQSADGALADLVALAAKRFPKGRLLYLAGEDRAGDLADELSKHAIAVETVVVYRAIALDALPPNIVPANLDGVLHYSRRSAATFIRLVGQPGVINLMHYCLSEDVAGILRETGAANIRTAASPTESDLLMLL